MIFGISLDKLAQHSTLTSSWAAAGCQSRTSILPVTAAEPPFRHKDPEHFKGVVKTAFNLGCGAAFDLNCPVLPVGQGEQELIGVRSQFFFDVQGAFGLLCFCGV